MALNDHLMTYTITDLKVIAYSGGTLGSTLVDVPGIRSLQVTVPNEAVELRGDNAVLSVVDQGNTLEWQAEKGGMNLEVLEIIFGGTATDTGATPNEIRTYKLNATDPRPYFGFVGVTPSDDAFSDLHVFVPKAKATGNLELTAQDQEFMVPTFSGRGVQHATHGLLQLIQHETATAAAIPS